MDRNYKEDIKINEDDLENEWIEQPSLYLYYGEAHADAVLEKEKASDELDLVHAQLDSQLRKDWEKHFEKAPSEAAIKSWIIQQEKYKKKLENLNKKTHNVNVLAVAKTAFDHRKKALENLVTLHVTGFHSEPKPPKNVTRRTHLGLKKK